ncbi:MAG: PAS domain S-box protein [Alphaproteobacteria bacterium]|nr:PAS domain S-box protein [Alphaproteobacteria bacterium]
MAQGMREPVWNLIPESGQALLASMMEDERVLSINVTSVAQGPFLATRRGGQGADSGAGNILTRDILYDGGRIGTVALEIDSSQRIGQFYFQSWRIYLANGVQLAFGIAVVTLVIWVLARLQRAQAYRQANVALQTEVGERARAEQALQESEARLLQAQRMAHLGHWTWHIEEDKTYWSEEHYRIFGLPPSNDPIDADAFFAQVDEADRENIHAAVDRCLATGEPYELEFGITRPDGARRAVFTRAEIEYDAAGNPARLIGMMQDITERKLAEEALATSERLHRSILDNMIDTFYRTNREGRIIIASPSAESLLGHPVEDLLGKAMVDFYKNPADRELFLQRLDEMGGQLSGFEAELVRKDGESVWVSTNARIWTGPSGEVMGVEGIARDIAENRKVAEQLRQAQKMEAVGQLTGGVAHDFNNILAIIMGNAELLGADIDGGDPKLRSIFRASLRGAELTQRLLAFSRRQALQPRPFDLAALVAGLSDMLERTLGELIEIETAMEDGLWPCMSDPGQVENALLNLAINARDAMPGGGKLRIEGRNVRLDAGDVVENSDAEPGDYVELIVSDTGAGMSPEILEHAMEPFFTTKDVGEGSGLGLSMVYGFARQSGGQLMINSKVDRGTTVRLFLPRVAEVTDENNVTRGERADMPRGQGEKILVLEDDDKVRAIAIEMLQDLGYRPVGVGDAAAAREALANEAGISLILSDVVLPGGVSGRQFAEEARHGAPGVKVIFMSGYPTGMADANGSIRETETLLDKPFRKSKLAEALREALE